jgi:hypothetical protein
LKIDHTISDLPRVVFEPIDEESPLDKMRRANMGYSAGILNLNQSLDIVGLPELGEEGDVRKDGSSSEPMGEMPRDGERVNNKPTNEDEPIDEAENDEASE